jgi:WD40 repeat protein
MLVNRLLLLSLLGSAALLATSLIGFAAEPAKEETRLDRYGDPLPAGAVTRLGTVRFRNGAHGAGFLPDGKTVVSAAQGGKAIHFWDARSGRLLRELDMGDLTIVVGRGAPFSMSRDGKSIALMGSQRDPNNKAYVSIIAVIDAATGKQLRVFEREPLDSPQALALTGDGKLLVSMGYSSALRIEEVATGTELLRHQFPRDHGTLALSADGSMLAVGTGPNTRKLFLWKWQTGNEPRPLTVPDRCGSYLGFSPDGKLLAEADDSEPTVRLWDTETGKVTRKLELPDEERYWIRNLGFAPDGKTLAVGVNRNRDYEVHLWNPQTGKLQGRLRRTGGHLAFSRDGKLLVAGRQVWDLAARKELSANEEAHVGQVESVLTDVKDAVITVSGDYTVRLWDAASAKQRLVLSHGFLIRAIALSPTGKHLVTDSLDDSVCLWDLVTGRKVFQLAGHGKTGGRRAVTFTPDGKHFLSWGDDMYLRKWDVTTGKAVFEHAIRPTGVRVFTEDDDTYEREMFFNIGDGALSPDGKMFVMSAGKQNFVFDASTGKELRAFPAEGFPQVSLAISPDSKMLLASASGPPVETKLPGGLTQHSIADKHPVSLWDLSSGKLLKQFTVAEQAAGPVAFSADGKLIAEAAGYPDSRIRIWETATGREVSLIDTGRGYVRCLAFMADGKRLVTGMEDSTALIWDLTTKP